MHVLPNEKLGRTSVILIGGFFLCLVLMSSLSAGGLRGGDSPLLLVLGLTGIGCAVVAFGAAAAALAKRDLAALVWAALLIGALVTLFLVGEFTQPH